MHKSVFLKVVFQFIFGVLLFGAFSSCVSYKKIPYFKDVYDSTASIQKIQSFVEPTIQFDDILSVSVNTLDLQSNSAINMPTSMSSGGGGTGGLGSSSNSAGGGLIGGSTSALSSLLGGSVGGGSLALPATSSYRVNKKGEIDMPLLGKLYVDGLTTSQLKDTIQRKMAEYYRMPTVDVRFANFKITVLGEVMRPGTFTVPNEKLTILDALGLSGDLTIFGKRDNVLLIRDSAENKQMVRLNLNSKKLVSSPYFYMKQNDVLYVEPSDAKIANLDAVQNRYITIASAVLSILIIVATRVNF